MGGRLVGDWGLRRDGLLVVSRATHWGLRALGLLFKQLFDFCSYFVLLRLMFLSIWGVLFVKFLNGFTGEGYGGACVDGFSVM